MTANYLNGLCNLDHCSHPRCWNYYRKIIKHQVSPRDTEETKHLTIDVAHQSIHNINADVLLNNGSNNQMLEGNRSRDTKHSALMEYLISRKKMSTQTLSKHQGMHLRDSTNLSRLQTKLSTLEVHEVFDIEELNSDWRKTFRAKDYYIWIPGNKEVKSLKDDNKKLRTIKTPVLQLAPVTDSRINSSVNFSTKKDNSYSTFVPDIFSQRTNSMKNKTISRPLSRIEPINNAIISRERGTKNIKENIRQRSLEATLSQVKMQIHNAVDKSFDRCFVYNNNQIYFMDDYSNNQDLCSSNQSRQPPTSPSDSEVLNTRDDFTSKVPKLGQVHFKGVSIIQSAAPDNSCNFKLEPQHRRISPIKSAISRRDIHTVSSEETGSCCDSMMTNAISSRSTLNDEDILPGISMLQMLQSSYRLIQERSDQIVDQSKETSKICDEFVPDHEVQLHKINMSYSRAAKSAPDKKVIRTDTPNPPPPTPDFPERFRSTSAAANINLKE